jgi:isopentenyl-diphosphate delta-isomerase
MVHDRNVSNRKDDHLRINLEKDVQSGFTTGLEDYVLEHCALPEINLKDVDTTCKFLGHALQFPMIISSMTGGNSEGGKINQHLAEAAQDQGVALGLGSQRAMLEQTELVSTFSVRSFAKSIPIFGNIGAVQFNYGLTVDDCLRLVDSIKADGLIVHLNPLQEALQPEGETQFAGLARKIETLCKKAEFPVIVKEVGWGISGKTARKLIDAGVSALDVAGAGGTSWSQVEANRIEEEGAQRIAFEFKKWGITTSDSILHVRTVNRKIPLIASGGIRNGIEVAKCIALGADICGVAGRILKAATKSTKAVIDDLAEIKQEMRIAMFATSSLQISDLRAQKISRLNG